MGHLLAPLPGLCRTSQTSQNRAMSAPRATICDAWTRVLHEIVIVPAAGVPNNLHDSFAGGAQSRTCSGGLAQTLWACDLGTGFGSVAPQARGPEEVCGSLSSDYWWRYVWLVRFLKSQPSFLLVLGSSLEPFNSPLFFPNWIYPDYRFQLPYFVRNSPKQSARFIILGNDYKISR